MLRTSPAVPALDAALRAAALAVLVVAAGTAGPAAALARAAAPDDLPKWGVISRPKGFSTIRVLAAPGLSVFLDGKSVGTTDVLQQGLYLEDLPAGAYTLRVEKSGFEPKSVEVTVAEGDTKEVRILGLKPAAPPTPAPRPLPTRPATASPAAASTPSPRPAPVRAAILERKPVEGGTLVVGVASGAVDVLPLVEKLKGECRCAPALEGMKKRKDGLYEFRVKLPEK